MAEKRNGEFADVASFEGSNTYGQLSQRVHVCEAETDRDKGLGDRSIFPDFRKEES